GLARVERGVAPGERGDALGQLARLLRDGPGEVLAEGGIRSLDLRLVDRDEAGEGRLGRPQDPWGTLSDLRLQLGLEDVDVEGLGQRPERHEDAEDHNEN